MTHITIEQFLPQKKPRHYDFETAPKYWSFSFSISPSNEHPGLISFKMDWLDLLAVQGTLKSLLQHHSSKDGKGLGVALPTPMPSGRSSHRESLRCLHHRDYLGREDLFLYSSSVCSCHLFLISSASVRSLPFLSFIKPIFA